MATVILHVDDSPSIRQWIITALAGKGFTILSAQDGVEALNILSTTSVDLLLSDLEMPRVDGLELANAVRNMPQHKHLPILILSSRNPETIPAKRREAVTGWVTKPVDSELLSRWIHRLLPG